MKNIVVAAFYKFVRLPDFKEKRDELQALCDTNRIKGTILMAHEGINGTIAGSREAMDIVLATIRADERFADLEHKESYTDVLPFYRMKVRLKKEIVKIGIETVDPTQHVGEYVEPEDWNALISDPDVVVIDTRNDFEVDIGTFRGAVNPHTETFCQFPEYVRQHLHPEEQPKIAMFCTGGIRCEKATAFMLDEGFKQIYHLKGGILKYLETMNPDNSLWEGECFVFDNRVAVDHKLEDGEYQQCHACRHPVTAEERLSPQYEEGVSCPYCYDKLTEQQLQRAAQRQKQVELARERGQEHIGQVL